MLLMYRSRNNLIMIVEIIKNRGRDYFSNTEHENKISMTQCLDEFRLKKPTKHLNKIKHVQTPQCVLTVQSQLRGNDLHKLLLLSLTDHLFVKQESPSSLAGATNLPSKFL